MNWDGAKRLVAQKAGLVLAQNITLIETGILGALEEIGTHLSIAQAIKTAPDLTIAADINYVTWATEYSRLISVKYQYALGTSTYTRLLDKKDPTEYERLNAGLQSQTTDNLDHYCIKGDRIWVGPGNSYSGGYIKVEYQRKLLPDDIENLPDSNLAVWGGLANILPVAEPQQDVYRRMFVSMLSPVAAVSSPTIEKHSTIQRNDQILRDEAYLGSLK